VWTHCISAGDGAFPAVAPPEPPEPPEPHPRAHHGQRVWVRATNGARDGGLVGGGAGEDGRRQGQVADLEWLVYDAMVI